jgi:hypothetical protein
METKSPIEYATVDDVYNFGNAVEALLKSKVADALAAQKQQVAQNIFNATEETDLDEEFQPHKELSAELAAHKGQVADVSHHGVLFSFNDPDAAKKFRGVASGKGYDTELAGTTLYVPNTLKSMYKEDDEVSEMVSPNFHRSYRQSAEKSYDDAVSKSQYADFKHDDKALTAHIDKAIKRSKGILRSRELENKGYKPNPLSTKIFKNKCKG